MRTRTNWISVLAVVGAIAAPAASARTLDGTVKLGGIFLDDEGDPSAVQEIYNVYDGFDLAQLTLNGTLAPRQYFRLDLRDLNRDSRRGSLVYRVPGSFRINAGYDRHRQLFTADRALASSRQDWSLGAELSPTRWLALSGSLNRQSRDGDRLGFPVGTASALGLRYDNWLLGGQLAADFRSGRRGGGISVRASDFEDRLDPRADRTGRVVAARLYAPTPSYDRWTHWVRGAYGVQRLATGEIDHTLYDFQYTTVFEPVNAWQLKYGFEGRRIDDESTQLTTDRFTNDVDVTWFHRWGQVSGGYGYETNDDDRSLTSYHAWRAGTLLRWRDLAKLKADYAGRVKQDQEDVTLLRDLEAFQVRTRLELRPVEQLVLGGGYAERDREFTDIDVEARGRVSSAFFRITAPHWTVVTGDYSYSTDRTIDRAGRFSTRSHIVTGRVELNRIKDVQLAAGVTYLQIGRDLDIEKSMVSLEAAYTVLRDYHVEAQYNVYNYDDYVLVNRYYTANLVQVRLARDLHLGD